MSTKKNNADITYWVSGQPSFSDLKRLDWNWDLPDFGNGRARRPLQGPSRWVDQIWSLDNLVRHSQSSPLLLW